MTDPGVNLERLRALRAPTHNSRLIQERIESHLEAHDGYVALSGGKDSLVVLDFARQVDPNVPVVFFDSGLEFPETYTYLADLQQTWQLNLELIPATTPLLNILITDGSWDHHALEYRTPSLHQALIAEPSASAHISHGPGELWGVRASESRGRRIAYNIALSAETCTCCHDAVAHRAHHGGIIRRENGTVAFSPIWDWTDPQVWSHIACRHLPVNPVYDRLRSMGVPQNDLRISHILDADHLDHGRAVWLKYGWPDLYERLRQLLPRLAEHL